MVDLQASQASTDPGQDPLNISQSASQGAQSESRERQEVATVVMVETIVQGYPV